MSLPVKSSPPCFHPQLWRPRCSITNLELYIHNSSSAPSSCLLNPLREIFSISINWQISRSQSAISRRFHDKPKRKLDVYWLSQPERREGRRPRDGQWRARLSDNNLFFFPFLRCLLYHFLLSTFCRSGWEVFRVVLKSFCMSRDNKHPSYCKSYREFMQCVYLHSNYSIITRERETMHW